MAMTNRLSWKDLNAADRAAICSGCGGKGGIVPVPEFIFTASCDRHDFYYWRGGNAADRRKADVGFLAAMLRDADSQVCALVMGTPPLSEADCAGHLVYRFSLPRRLWYRATAYAYFAAVRFVGWRFFHFGVPKTRWDLALMRARRKDAADRASLARLMEVPPVALGQSKGDE